MDTIELTELKRKAKNGDPNAKKELIKIASEEIDGYNEKIQFLQQFRNRIKRNESSAICDREAVKRYYQAYMEVAQYIPVSIKEKTEFLMFCSKAVPGLVRISEGETEPMLVEREFDRLSKTTENPFTAVSRQKPQPEPQIISSRRDTEELTPIETIRARESVIQEKRCPKCNFMNKGDVVFCSNCGSLLDTGRASARNLPENEPKGLSSGVKNGIIFGCIALVAVILVVGIVLNKDQFVDDDDYGAYDNDEYYEEDAAYDPDKYQGHETEFYFYDSDSRYLSDSDVDDLGVDELQWAINEIYARHGRIFQDDPYGSYFNSCDWYTPMYSSDEFNDAWFNDYEKENIALLSEYRARRSEE